MAPSECLDHLRSDLAGEQRQDLAAVDLVTERGRLLGELCRELVEAQLRTLESGPRVLVMVRGVDLTQEPGRQPAVLLEAGERLERRRQDHSPEIEQRGTDHGRG